MLACIDLEGVVLSSLSGRGSASRELKQVFRVGAQLSEQNIGTTAPGCALAEGDSVFFVGEEHYLEEARQFSCLATPIFGLDGGIVGVLDASSRQGASSVYTLESLVFAARAIENRLFAQLGDVLLVHLHYRLDILGTPLEGLLALTRRAAALRQPHRRPVAAYGRGARGPGLRRAVRHALRPRRLFSPP